MLWLRAILLLTCLTSLWSGPPEQPRASEHGAAFVLVVGQMADRVVAVIGMVSIQSFDAETGLVYLRNRYYEPDLGCFTQVDPARAGDDWYGYAGGDPVNRWDPSGLFTMEGMYTEYFKQFGEEGAQLLAWAAQKGYRVKPRGYWFDDWAIEEGRIIGIKRHNMGFERSNANAAAQLM